MSQYSTGTATVTNGSATVTGTNTLWLANVTAGDSFTVAGDGVMYDVASVDSDTQITLSVNYAGVTASGVVYAIGTGFTVPDSFPEMSQGDIETATIFTRAMRKIQGKFTAILAGGSGANFTAMPQVGGDPIVESGSNVDGEWTRWADGTQVEFTTIQEDLPTAINNAGDISNFDMARSSPLNGDWNGAAAKVYGRAAGGGGNRSDLAIVGRFTENVKVFRPIGLTTSSTGTTGTFCKHIVLSLMKVSRWT
jgi:hypothetical protein